MAKVDKTSNQVRPWKLNGDALVDVRHGFYLFRLDEYPGIGSYAKACMSAIEAAPEMLEALKKIEDAALHGYLTPDLCASLVIPAISKAEGRT